MPGYLNGIHVRDSTGRVYGEVHTSDSFAAREVFVAAALQWFDEHATEWGNGPTNGMVPELRIEIR